LPSAILLLEVFVGFFPATACIRAWRFPPYLREARRGLRFGAAAPNIFLFIVIIRD